MQDDLCLSRDRYAQPVQARLCVQAKLAVFFLTNLRRIVVKMAKAERYKTRHAAHFKQSEETGT